MINLKHRSYFSGDPNWQGHRRFLVLDNAPSPMVALNGQKDARPAVLTHGKWLVLVVGAWSVPDVASIGTLAEVLRNHTLGIQVGVRVVYDENEIFGWFPEISREALMPQWIIIENNNVILTEEGLCSYDEVVQLLSNAP